MDKVTYFEIPVNNLKRAKNFFRKMFGWKIEDWDSNYAHVMTVKTDRNWMPKEKGAINGGLVKRQTKNESPLLVVEVPSITEYLKKVKKAGGKVVTDKQQMGKWGYWAEIMDTEGNVLELWEDNE